MTYDTQSGPLNTVPFEHIREFVVSTNYRCRPVRLFFVSIPRCARALARTIDKKMTSFITEATLLHYTINKNSRLALSNFTSHHRGTK